MISAQTSTQTSTRTSAQASNQTSNPPSTSRFTVERGVRLLAGGMVLASLALSRWSSHYWLLLTLFVGANLFQSALTGICPAEFILRSLGLKQGSGCCS